MQYTPIKRCLRLVVFAFLLNLSGCYSGVAEKYIVAVDMSAEYKEGRFQPQSGDYVTLAGNFNNWNKDKLILKPESGSRIYTAAIDRLLLTDDFNSDTLRFKFIHHSGDGRQIANQGWEVIENRTLPVVELYENEILFTFNEKYDPRKTATVTFTVGMAAQKILGFFEPESGDKIVVTGNFIDWNPAGIEMEKLKENVYRTTYPVKYHPGQPIEYKFKIITKRDVMLPNNGWESTPNRFLQIDAGKVFADYADFNNLKRVVRFIVNVENLIDKGKFKPYEGDILQIKITADRKSYFSDELIKTEKHIYETSVALPLTIDKINYAVMLNRNEIVTIGKNEIIPINGGIITIK